MEKEFTTFNGYRDIRILNEQEEIAVELEGEAGLDSQDNIPVTVKKEDSTENETDVKKTLKLIKPNTLPDDVIDLLNERIGDEYKAYFFYRNAANWCKGVNYNKASDFFEKEAENELVHSKGLQDYLSKWNTYPTIPSAPTTQDFESLVDIINKAYEIEYTLLMKYSNDITQLMAKHPATFNFLQDYVDIQNDEVSEYSDLLNALELVNLDNKLDVLYFEKNYF